MSTLGAMYAVLGVQFMVGIVRIRWSIALIGKDLTNQIATTFIFSALGVALAIPKAADELFVTGSKRLFLRFCLTIVLISLAGWLACLGIDTIRPGTISKLGLNSDFVCWVGAPLSGLLFIFVSTLFSRIDRNFARAIFEAVCALFTLGCTVAVFILRNKSLLIWELIGIAGLLPTIVTLIIYHKKFFKNEQPLTSENTKPTTWLMRISQMITYFLRPLLNLVFNSGLVIVLSQARQGGNYTAQLIKGAMLCFRGRLNRSKLFVFRIVVAVLMTTALLGYIILGGLYSEVAGHVVLLSIIMTAVYFLWVGIEQTRMMLLFKSKIKGTGLCTILPLAALLVSIVPTLFFADDKKLIVYLVSLLILLICGWLVHWKIIGGKIKLEDDG